MDLHMPGIGGIEAARRIAQLTSATAVLVMCDADGTVVTAVQAGARGLDGPLVGAIIREIEDHGIGRSVRATDATNLSTR